jgi:cbb3-type cytochrome c oxidase subunit III
MPQDRRSRGFGDVAIAIAAIAFTMLGVALAAYWGGKNNASTTTEAAPSVSYPKVTPQEAAGAHAFLQFACAQCHGDRGVGGVSPDVPALQAIAPSLTVEQLTSIIEHGAGASDASDKPFMPVWTGVISTNQISDLVAYMRAGFPAVQGAEVVTVPQDQGDAVAGAFLYQRYGCINCHGPNGLGGVPNPLSEDKSIPPLVGADFKNEFDDQAIAQIIRDGSVIGKQPIVSMPHWGTILTDQQIHQLVVYIDSLTASAS